MKKYLPVALTFVLFISLYAISQAIPEGDLQRFIRSAGVLAPIVYIVIALVTNIFAPLSGTPIIFAGYYVFSVDVIYWSAIANFLSFITNYWIARKWGRPLVGKIIGNGNMERLNELTRDYGLLSLFLLRVFQGGIGDFISYAAGLTPIKFWPYLAVSTVALIPGYLVWFYFSRYIDTPLGFTLLNLGLATVLSAIFIVGSWLIKSIKKKKELS